MNKSTLQINTEIFVIPYKNNFIVYSPLQGSVILANLDLIMTLKQIKSGKTDNLNSDIIEKLISTGFVNTEKDKAPSIDYEKYSPKGVALLLTHKCNLRCSYCYSRGGERKDTLETRVGEKAIDFIINNAIQDKRKEINIMFHGGGEPTIAWKELVKLHDYSVEKAKLNGLYVLFKISTNGTIKDENKLEWLANNINFIQLSFDGIFQNKQRRFANGEDSTNVVYNTAKKFDSLKKDYIIRSTIYPENIKDMEKLLNYFLENFNSKNIKICPTFNRGESRCSVHLNVNDYDILREQTSLLNENRYNDFLVLPLNMKVITSTHCGGCGTNFVITPTGEVTTCFEVDSKNNKYAEKFIIGEFSKEKDDFLFYEERIKYLKTRQVQNIKECGHCFVKWHCAGDCPIVSLDKGDFYSASGLSCNYIKEVGRNRLIATLNNN